MKQSGGIARRYAVALGEVASKEGMLDKVGRELRLLQELDSSSEDFHTVLTSPRVPLEKKTELLMAALETKVSSLVLDFLQLLVKKRRESYLSAIVGEYEAFADRELGVRRADVTSAVPLSEQAQSELEERLSKMTGEKMRLVFKEDPAILGGLRVRIGDTVIDGSVSERLRRLKNSFQAIQVRSQE